MKKKTILKCGCGNVSGDILLNGSAWNGWQVVPHDTCPSCIQAAIQTRTDQQVDVRESRSGGRVIRTFSVRGVGDAN